MAAPVPVIYPRKLEVSSTESFYIRCNNPNSSSKESIPGYDIYFTLNGRKPDPNERGTNKSTIKYKKPFKLDPGKHHIKALSIVTGNRRAAPSSIASKSYEVDYNPPNKHSSKPRRVNPDIRAELAMDDSDVVGYPGNDSDAGSDEEAFTEAEYLASRHKYRIKNELEDFGLQCELCKTPRSKDRHGILLSTCVLCGYRFADLGSTELRETRQLAGRITASSSPTRTKGIGQPEPYATVDIHGTSVHGSPTQHFFTDQDGVKLGVASGTLTPGSPGSTQQVLQTQNLRDVMTSPFSGGQSSFLPRDAGMPANMHASPGTRPDPSDHQHQHQHQHQHHPTGLSAGASVTLPRPTTAPTAPTQGRGRMGQEFKLCATCQRPNPAHLASCAICFESMANVGVMGRHPAAAPAHTISVDGECPNCSTKNDPAARFCNWCGFKYPTKPAKMVPMDLADRITAGGGDHSVMQQFTMLPDGTMAQVAAPVQQDMSWGYHLDGNLGTTKIHAPAPVSGDVGRKGEPGQDMVGVRTPKAGKKKKLKDTASQTGLYFASSKTLDMEKMRLETAIEGNKPERSIYVGEISPGNGYWRQQCDHVLAKLKAFSRDTPKFQLQMGQHRMGDVTGAQIRQDGDQILLTVSLTDKSFDQKKKSGAKRRVFEGVNYSVTQSMAGTQTPINDFLDQNGTLAPLKKLEPKKKKTNTREADRKRIDKLTEALFVALGPDGSHTKAETILGLLDQGADVHGFNSDRDRPLHVAAYFGRVEAVKFLLDAEADVNAAGSMGDTPLHAAVRGDHRFVKDVMTALIEARASTESQNIDTLTPCGLASEIGKKHLVAFFGKKLSEATLKTLGKSKIRS